MPILLPISRWALTPPFHPYSHLVSGFFSVALSLGLPQAGVTRRHCCKESGLSSLSRGRPAIRPTRILDRDRCVNNHYCELFIFTCGQSFASAIIVPISIGDRFPTCSGKNLSRNTSRIFNHSSIVSLAER